MPRKPARTRAWSSATSTRRVTTAPRGAAAGPAPRIRRPAGAAHAGAAAQADPLPHADDPVPGAFRPLPTRTGGRTATAAPAGVPGPGRAAAVPRTARPTSDGTPSPGSVISTSRLPAPYSSTTWQRSAPECLTTLVSASCTMRNADRSRLAGRLRGVPIRSTVTVTPAPAVRSTSRSRLASPGAGASGAAGRNRAARSRSPAAVAPSAADPAAGPRPRPPGRLRRSRWPARCRRWPRPAPVPLAVPGARGAGSCGGSVLGQSRVGRRDVPVRLAEHAQHPLHLAQRLAAHRLDRAQRGPGLGGLAVEHVLAEPGLHGDHRHAVRHDVVQFPGDPEPFPGDRVGGRPVPQVRDVGPPLLHQVPDHPEDGEHQPGGGRVAGPESLEVQHHALRDQQAQRPRPGRPARSPGGRLTRPGTAPPPAAGTGRG